MKYTKSQIFKMAWAAAKKAAEIWLRSRERPKKGDRNKRDRKSISCGSGHGIGTGVLVPEIYYQINTAYIRFREPD